MAQAGLALELAQLTQAAEYGSMNESPGIEFAHQEKNTQLTVLNSRSWPWKGFF